MAHRAAAHNVRSTASGYGANYAALVVDANTGRTLYAINPDSLGKEPYRVTVSAPYAGGTARDCKVGRTGRVIFGDAPAQASP